MGYSHPSLTAYRDYGIGDEPGNKRCRRSSMRLQASAGGIKALGAATGTESRSMDLHATTILVLAGFEDFPSQ
jgi:hypothetical protein